MREYKIIFIATSIISTDVMEEKLNQLAQCGWRLVGVSPVFSSGGVQRGHDCFLERDK